MLTIEEKWIPKKFHPFLQDPLRKVFLPDDSELKEKAKKLEQDVIAIQIALQNAQNQLVTTQNLFEQLDTKFKAEQSRYTLLDRAHLGRFEALKNAQQLAAQSRDELQKERQAHIQTSRREREKDVQVAKLNLVIAGLKGKQPQPQATPTQDQTAAQSDNPFSFTVPPFAFTSTAPPSFSFGHPPVNSSTSAGLFGSSSVFGQASSNVNAGQPNPFGGFSGFGQPSTTANTKEVFSTGLFGQPSNPSAQSSFTTPKFSFS